MTAGKPMTFSIRFLNQTCSMSEPSCDPGGMLIAVGLCSLVYIGAAVRAWSIVRRNRDAGRLADRPLLTWGMLVNVLLFMPLLQLDNRRLIAGAKTVLGLAAFLLPIYFLVAVAMAYVGPVPPGFIFSVTISMVGFAVVLLSGSVAVVLAARPETNSP